MQTIYGDTWLSISPPYYIDLRAIIWRSEWPIFHDSVILPYIWKTIWCFNVKDLDNEYVSGFALMAKEHLTTNVGHSDLYFKSRDSPYILETIWLINVKLLDNGSVWCSIWPQKNVRRSELYFTDNWFCLVSWRLFYIRMSFLRYWISMTHTFDHLKDVGHWHMFHGQVIFLIASKLFDGWTSCLDQCD